MNKVVKNIHEKEEQLLNEYAQSNGLNIDEISWDGLMFKGDIIYGSNGRWTREEGNEENMWNQDKTRLMIIAKDQNVKDEDPWDVREETGRDNDSGKDNIAFNDTFHRNLILLAYGISKTTANEYPFYNELINEEGIISSECQEGYENMPIVGLNLKKTPGGGSINNNALTNSLNHGNNSAIIKKQMELYDANIFLCCGGNVYEFVKNNIDDFADAKDMDGSNTIFYSKASGKILINSYHPSYSYYNQVSDEEIYNAVVVRLHNFLRKIS